MTAYAQFQAMLKTANIQFYSKKYRGDDGTKNIVVMAMNVGDAVKEARIEFRFGGRGQLRDIISWTNVRNPVRKTTSTY